MYACLWVVHASAGGWGAALGIVWCGAWARHHSGQTAHHVSLLSSWRSDPMAWGCRWDLWAQGVWWWWGRGVYLGVPSSVPVCSPPSSPSYLLTSLLNSSSSLVLDYPRAWYETASWLLIMAVWGISQVVVEWWSGWVLMETMGPVGDQTGNTDVSCSGVVGADGGVVEGVVDGRPPNPCQNPHLTCGYTHTHAGSCWPLFMCACPCSCSPLSVVPVESQYD
jgi:hypothetical protein